MGLDPRSPAADFDRTPILKPRSLALIKARSQEALNRRGSYELDVYKLTKSHQEINTSLNIPKLPNVISETSNMLDMEKQDDSHIFCIPQQCDSDSSVFEEEEVIKNLKCKNEKEISIEHTVPTDRNKDDTDIKKDCKDIEHDIKAVHIKDDENEVWYDSVSEENIAGKKEKENIVEKLSQKKGSREDIIITFDECATISILPKPIKRGDYQKKEDIARKKKTAKIDDTVTLNEKKIFNPENKMHGIEMLKVIYDVMKLYTCA